MANKKSPKKKNISSKADEEKEKGFKLNDKHWDQLDEFEVYTTEKKVTRIFGVRNKKTSSIDPKRKPYIKARTRSKSPFGWKYIHGIDLHLPSHVSRFIHGLLSVAKKLGWKIQRTDDIQKLKTQLRESEEAIVSLEHTNKEWREKHEKLMEAFRKKQDQILRSKVQKFENDISDMESLLARSDKGEVSEQELQEFLYNHPWLFGTEYINAQPQKLRGAHSKFDFYLERFNKTNDVVEIKLASDQIINKDEGLNAKVSQAIDQLINYMESSQAAAHSRVISQEEDMRELRPRGIVIIGNDTSTKTKEKLHKWNYQLAHITILTYSDVLIRAQSVIQHLKVQDEVN